MNWNGGRTSPFIILLIICTTRLSLAATAATAAAFNNVTINYDKKVCANEPTCRLLFENEAILSQRRRTLQGRDCMCDANCMEYQDCCKDAPSFVDDPSYQPMKTYICPSYANVYMIDSCFSNYPEETIKQLCADGKRFQQGDTISIATPVTSVDTRATYINQYCAACNRETDWQTWNISTRCTELPLRNNVLESSRPPYVYQPITNSFPALNPDLSTSESSFVDSYTSFNPNLQFGNSNEENAYNANFGDSRISSSSENSQSFSNSADSQSSQNLGNLQSSQNSNSQSLANPGDLQTSQNSGDDLSSSVSGDAQSSISSTENINPSVDIASAIKTNGPVNVMQFFFNFFPLIQLSNERSAGIDVNEGVSLNERSSPIGNSVSKKVDSPVGTFGVRIKIGRSKRQHRYSALSKNDELGKIATYDLGTDKFYAKHGGKEYSCSFKTTLPREFENLVRRCVPNLISSCPREDYQSMICRSYTAIVYDKRTNRAYKNKDCALCNGVPLSRLTGCPLVTRIAGGADNVSNPNSKAKNNVDRTDVRIADSQGFNQARR